MLKFSIMKEVDDLWVRYVRICDNAFGMRRLGKEPPSRYSKPSEDFALAYYLSLPDAIESTSIRVSHSHKRSIRRAFAEWLAAEMEVMQSGVGFEHICALAAKETAKMLAPRDDNGGVSALNRFAREAANLYRS